MAQNLCIAKKDLWIPALVGKLVDFNLKKAIILMTCFDYQKAMHFVTIEMPLIIIYARYAFKRGIRLGIHKSFLAIDSEPFD